MVAENGWPMLLVQPAPVECGICGKKHEFEKCSLIENIKEHVKDTLTPSYAQLTLPADLEIFSLSDGQKTVRTTKPMTKGVQFGPFIAKTSTIMDMRIDFPIKVFLNDEDSVFLESYDEVFCNWMCFVRPATDYSQQNLFCYQIKGSIYFCTMRDIEKYEELHVWYAPHYGEKMGATMFAKPLDLVHSSDEDFQEIYTSLINGAEVLDHSYMPKVKRKRKPVKKPVVGENYYREIPHNDLLPGEILGAKERRQEWVCQECGRAETSVAAYARHLMEHLKSKFSRFTCPYCPKYFRKDGYNRKIHIDMCKKEHDAKVTKNATADISSSLTETNTVNTTLNVADKEKEVNNESQLVFLNGGNRILWNPNDCTIVVAGGIGDADQSSVLEMEKGLEGKAISTGEKENTKPEKNMDILDSEAEIIMSKNQLSAPILDLGDDIDFNLAKSLVEMINDDSNPDKSARSLNLFESISGPSLLSSDAMLESSNVGASSFYTPAKSGYQQTGFANCDDVTDEDRNRIVENLLSETDDKYLTTDYEMSDACVSENQDIEFNIESKSGTNVQDKKKLKSKTDGQYKCDICKKSFAKHLYLYRHLRKHTGEFRCNQCFTVFARKETLISHRLSCSTEAKLQDKVVRTRIPCKICHMQFSSLTALHIHIETHYCKNSTWKCGCLKDSDDSSLLENHGCPLKVVEVICTACRNVFTSAEAFANHKKDITFSRKKYSKSSSILCEYCGMTFTSKSGYRNHKIKHNGGKLECPICHKKFVRHFTFIEHRQTHDTPQWECPICKKMYYTKQKYRFHQRTAHSDQRYTCEICNKEYRQKVAYKKHLKIHDTSQTFVCEKCNKVCSTKKSYNEHILTHKDHIYRCQLCDKSFCTNWNLKVHIRLKHTEMYNCTYCQINIRYRHTLKKHLTAKHKDKIDEWNSREALVAMRIRNDSDVTDKEKEKGELVISGSTVKDILQTAADVVLEDSLQSEQVDEPMAIPERDQTLGLPLAVIGDCDMSLVAQTGADQATSLSECTSDEVTINLVDTSQAMELTDGLESVIVNFPIALPEVYQLALDDNQPLKQLSDDVTGLVDPVNLQDIGGASTFIMSGDSINASEPVLAMEDNVLYYVIDTSVANGLTLDPYADSEQSILT